MSGVRHDDHEGAGCETIFPFWLQSTHGDGARHEMTVPAWPWTTCGARHDDHDGAHYETSALGWPWTMHGARCDGDAAEGRCRAPKILQRW